MAAAAVCAGFQNKYWQMHRALFSRAAENKQRSISELADEIGLDTIEFATCIKRDAARRVIEEDMASAASFDLKVTPAFALGQVDETGRVVIQRFIIGAQSFETL